MAFLQSDIDALDAAFKTGVSMIKAADGREMQFRSVEGYLKLRGLMLGEVAALSAIQPIRQTRFFSSKGL